MASAELELTGVVPSERSPGAPRDHVDHRPPPGAEDNTPSSSALDRTPEHQRGRVWSGDGSASGSSRSPRPRAEGLSRSESESRSDAAPPVVSSSTPGSPPNASSRKQSRTSNKSSSRRTNKQRQRDRARAKLTQLHGFRYGSGDKVEQLECVTNKTETANVRWTNYVKTSRYTWYDFLPKNLFEQFKNLDKIYFLMIVILQMIPEVKIEVEC